MAPNDALIALAKQIARARGVDPVLACAVVEQESAWDTYAIRYEPAFFAKYIMPQYAANKFTATEAYARGFSWGLCQVMGQVAREFGFDEGELSKLLMPERGLDVGCKVLAHKIDGANGDVTAGLLHYNGGSNQMYPQEVISRMEKYR